MERFGEKLRQLRTQHGLSYRQLAKQLETSHSHIINLETGKHKPSVDLIVRIAGLFDVSFDQLMNDTIDLPG
jgi:transcriptional regulator with XRE-family HTH domain